VGKLNLKLRSQLCTKLLIEILLIQEWLWTFETWGRDCYINSKINLVFVFLKKINFKKMNYFLIFDSVMKNKVENNF